MKKIGEGYFYEVFDIGGGRVLKRQKKGFKLFWHIFMIHKFLPLGFKEYFTALRTIPHIKEVYRHIDARISSKGILGNPRFLEGIDYEQDKVTIMYEAMHDMPQDAFERRVREYIALMKGLWRCGCHERVYNFSINNGIDASGELVLIDFNEMTFDKEYVRKSIAEQRWLKRFSYFQLSNNRKAYYKKIMVEEVTVEALDRLWGTSNTTS